VPPDRARRASGLAALALTALLPSAAGAAQGDTVAEVEETARKAITAVRTDSPPRIDGRLDDPAWAAVPADDRFTQSFPAEGKPPTHRTELRILYDDQALYVGVRLHDPQPDQIVARLTRRDRIPESDAVILRLDSRHDHSTAYVFRLHASGVQSDNFSYDDGGGTSPEWDAVWAGEAAIDEGGWNAEYRIPLSALRFAGRPDQTWGIQVVRYVSRTGETDVWSYWPTSRRGEVSHYDHVVGLKDLRSRRTFELRPYLLGRVRAATPTGSSFLGYRGKGHRSADGDLGLDLKLGVTSELTFDLTVNPDFGQVEADPAVLNLTRYESFFPEKRPFFLEGTDLLRTPIQLFYSRRIGRRPSGLRAGRRFTAGSEMLTVTEAPASLRIWTAGKLSGKASRNLSVAALSALTDAERVTATGTGGEREVSLAPLRNYSVLRTRYGGNGPTYLGLMATGVSRLGGHLFRGADDHDAYAQSLDGQWQSPGAGWRLGGQGLITERIGGTTHATAAGTPCPTPTAASGCRPITRADGTKLFPGALGYGAIARVSHQGEHFLEEISGDVLSPLVDPNDAGFLTDYNRRRVGATLGYQDREPGPRLQNFIVTLNQTASYDFRDIRIGTTSYFEFSALLTDFWYVNPGFSYEWPGTWDRDELLDGGNFERLPRLAGHLYVASDGRKPVTGDLNVAYARNLGDQAYSAELSSSLSFRVFSRLELTVAEGLVWDGGATRLFDCQDAAGQGCHADTDLRSYRFAALDAGSLSLTMRATLALTPRLSFQTYGQLFMAQGTYSSYRAVSTRGPRYIRRHNLMPSSFAGDSDGDGKQDDDFEQVSLTGNAVLRWEPWPGADLFAVYTRAQAVTPALGGLAPRFRAGGLLMAPTEDIVALKLVLYWAL
jgi:hypothetical protein